MYDRLFGCLLAYPWVSITAGRGLITLAGLMGILGLRVDRLERRLARVFDRYGVETPDVMAGFPWWLRMLTPETTAGWIGVALVLVTGFYLVYLGKWAKRMQA
jgi:hypothetical protein